MKKGTSENIVRVKGVPKLTEAQLEDLKRLAELSDEGIDYSDIPEIVDFSSFEVGKFYRPVKESITVRLDADVVHWLKQAARGTRPGSMQSCAGRWRRAAKRREGNK